MPLSGIGFGEMLVIAMLVLIVFGPQRLPEITRSLGKAMREFKRGMNEIQRELEVADRQQKWGASSPAARTSVPPAGTPPAGTVAAGSGGAAVAAATATAETKDAATTPASAREPTIAPPTFGSDLPDEIESQLAPHPTRTAANPRRVVPPEGDPPEAAEASTTAGSSAAAGSETRETPETDRAADE